MTDDNLSDVSIRLIDSWDEAQAFARWLGERRPVLAVDLETSGLLWWSDSIRTCQIGDALTGWVFEWDRWSGLLEHTLSVYEEGPIALHNFMFDLPFLEANNVPLDPERVDDTRAMAHIIDPDRPTGLKPLADKLISRQASYGAKLLHDGMQKNDWDWETVPITFEPYWFYGGLDTVFTARLWEKFKPYMHGKASEIFDLEMASQIALMRMSQRGMRIDEEYIKTARKKLKKDMDDIATELKSDYGITKIGSAPQVADAIQLHSKPSLEWKQEWRTESGQRGTSKKVLEQIDHPVSNLVLDWRHKAKIVGSYFDNLTERVDEHGFVHASINPLGTRTGRMTVTGPALNTLHRDAIVRDAFIPREGNKLVLVDYDQMELRLLSHLAEVSGLQQAFVDEPDVHAWMARQIYGVETATKRQRTISKNATYARLYGGGPDKFAETAGISQTEAGEFYRMIDTTFPEIKTFSRKLQEDAKRVAKLYGTKPFIYTVLGRYQPVMSGDIAWKLINYKIQGSCADYLKRAIVHLSNAGLGAFMVLPVHDEIISDVPADLALDVAHEVMKIMAVTETTPHLTVSGSIVQKWGDPYDPSRMSVKEREVELW